MVEIENLKVTLPVMFDKIKCKSSVYVKEFERDFVNNFYYYKIQNII